MKILVTPNSFKDAGNKAARDMIESFADEVVYNDLCRIMTEDEVMERLQGVDGFIAGIDYITEKAIANADRLKVISRYGAGVDRVDIAAATARGIKVTNTPGANSIAVCELAFGLMLNLARHITDVHNEVSAGGWPHSRGIELYGKTLGIIGLGNIGKNVAVRARAFGMEVIAYDNYFDEAFAEKNSVRRVTLDELFRTSDFITIHAPKTDETAHLINRDTIAAMKDKVILINTARGGIIDEQAAADALRSGKLGGIGLDAFEQEPMTDSPLKGLKNAVFTCHIGANTAEAGANMGRMAVENCIAVLKGKPCKCIINK